ncbi:MAG TPA: M48 family metallopeptidase [Woeseiaceae bacterium]|nr:M48 family metallopeptidase [Woeseiaceae bacterium]
MRFVARQPAEGINVSKTHPLVEASTLVIGLAAIFVLITVVLIFLVEIALYFVPVEKEAALFDGWLPDDLVTVAHTDERLNETQHLVDRLAVHWPESPYQFRVEIDDSDVANAMALPGGLVIVTQGLLDQVESENELAFVLGHELGHFKNRDHLRALGRGVVLSLFLAVTTGDDVAGIGITAADITLRGFNRRQESNADAFGLSLVNAEYGHVTESWRLFERWEIQDDSMLRFVAYLSTHPDTGDRITDMKELARSEGWSMDGAVAPLNW